MPAVGEDPVALGFDPDELRDRYRRERDKRVRADGADQYLEAAGSLARFAAGDPFAEPAPVRAAIRDDIDVVIVGGGFSGLLAAARLIERGVTGFRIVEAGADFGGTWYWNRYPGAQCDTDAYCYLPLLEELGVMPTQKYADAVEIFEHSQRIGRHYELYDRTLFRTRVERMRWHDDASRWVLSTDHGDELRARFVVMALGTMTRPKLPGIDGIDSFRGHMFHTSRWDYDYTGGGPDQRRRSRHRVPAHAVIGRLAAQPSDRPGVGGDAATRMATRATGELQRDRIRSRRRRGSRRRRMDRHLPVHLVTEGREPAPYT
jgi:cyclohexanone monooxygenase